MGAGGQRRVTRPTQGSILENFQPNSEAETTRNEFVCPIGDTAIAVPREKPTLNPQPKTLNPKP